jgi:hypothetical protein
MSDGQINFKTAVYSDKKSVLLENLFGSLNEFPGLAYLIKLCLAFVFVVPATFLFWAYLGKLFFSH